MARHRDQTSTRTTHDNIGISGTPSAHDRLSRVVGSLTYRAILPSSLWIPPEHPRRRPHQERPRLASPDSLLFAIHKSLKSPRSPACAAFLGTPAGSRSLLGPRLSGAPCRFGALGDAASEPHRPRDTGAPRRPPSRAPREDWRSLLSRAQSRHRRLLHPVTTLM